MAAADALASQPQTGYLGMNLPLLDVVCTSICVCAELYGNSMSPPTAEIASHARPILFERYKVYLLVGHGAIRSGCFAAHVPSAHTVKTTCSLRLKLTVDVALLPLFRCIWCKHGRAICTYHSQQEGSSITTTSPPSGYGCTGYRP